MASDPVADVIITVTGAIVNARALARYNDAYLITGDRERALAVLHEEAFREDWARRKVAEAGESFKTHMAKFDGTILLRDTGGYRG